MSIEIIAAGEIRPPASSRKCDLLVSFRAVATGDLYQRRIQGNSYGDHIALSCIPIYSAQRPIEINWEKL